MSFMVSGADKLLGWTGAKDIYSACASTYEGEFAKAGKLATVGVLKAALTATAVYSSYLAYTYMMSDEIDEPPIQLDQLKWDQCPLGGYANSTLADLPQCLSTDGPTTDLTQLKWSPLSIEGYTTPSPLELRQSLPTELAPSLLGNTTMPSIEGILSNNTLPTYLSDAITSVPQNLATLEPFAVSLLSGMVGTEAVVPSLSPSPTNQMSNMSAKIDSLPGDTEPAMPLNDEVTSTETPSYVTQLKPIGLSLKASDFLETADIASTSFTPNPHVFTSSARTPRVQPHLQPSGTPEPSRTVGSGELSPTSSPRAVNTKVAELFNSTDSSIPPSDINAAAHTPTLFTAYTPADLPQSLPNVGLIAAPELTETGAIGELAPALSPSLVGLVENRDTTGANFLSSPESAMPQSGIVIADYTPASFAADTPAEIAQSLPNPEVIAAPELSRTIATGELAPALSPSLVTQAGNATTTATGRLNSPESLMAPVDIALNASTPA